MSRMSIQIDFARFIPRIPVNEYAPLFNFKFKLDRTHGPDFKSRKILIFFFVPKRPEPMRDTLDVGNPGSWPVIPCIFNVDSFEGTRLGHKLPL